MVSEKQIVEEKKNAIAQGSLKNVRMRVNNYLS